MSDKILVLNGNAYAEALIGLGDISFDKKEFMRKPDDFKLVQFTGGEDVSPSLYGDTSPKGMCHNSMRRDVEEREIFNIAYENGIKMAGICRGSQFLNVMSGGRMLHDIGNHAGVGHEMTTIKGNRVKVNSSHHQMSVVGKGGTVFGWSTEKRSNRYIGWGDEPEDAPEKETEALYYPATRCVGVQYHPEWLPKDSDGYLYYHRLILDFLRMTEEQFTERYISVDRKLLEASGVRR